MSIMNLARFLDKIAMNIQIDYISASNNNYKINLSKSQHYFKHLQNTLNTQIHITKFMQEPENHKTISKFKDLYFKQIYYVYISFNAIKISELSKPIYTFNKISI